MELLKTGQKSWQDNKVMIPEKPLNTYSTKGGTPLGRLPNWGTDNINNKKMNKYLTHQETRIIKAIEEKKYNKAVLLGCIMLKNSVAYQITLLNKVYPSGYRKLSEQEARKLLMKTINKCRGGKLELYLERFYIEKSNGKFRPIGAPTMESRVISRCFNDMIYTVFHDHFCNFQHGYRERRGVHTALGEVGKGNQIDNLKCVFEFDFKSYFNTVRPSGVYRYLLKRSKHLAELISKIIINIRYFYKELKPEEELKIIGKVKHYGRTKDLVNRKGLPQGLSISPLLATLVLEMTSPPKNLIMYADDGVFLSNGNNKPFGDGIQQVEYFGVRVAEDKTGERKGIFEFLGVSFDFENNKMGYFDKVKNKTFKFCGDKRFIHSPKVHEDVMRFFKRIVHKYHKEKESKGEGEVNEKSYIMRYNKPKMTLLEQMTIMTFNILGGEAYLGYKYVLGRGIFRICDSSSKCLNDLINDIVLLKFLTKRKKLNLIEDNKFEHGQMDKRNYYESLYENSLRGYTRTHLPEGPNVHETLNAIDGE